MSYYCSSWVSNIANGISDFQDGARISDVYDDVRCSSFDRNDWTTVNAFDEVVNSGSGDEVTCNEHGLTAIWLDDPIIADDLRAAGISVCDDCDTAYHTLDAHNEHWLDDHDDDDDDDDDYEPVHPDLLDARGNVIGVWNFHTGAYRKPLTTSHSNWSMA